LLSSGPEVSTMSNSQAAARHVPVAVGRRRENAARLQAVETTERTHASEMRMQAAVVVDTKKDVDDPSSDVPCTD
jgi:hypothetical protein